MFCEVPALLNHIRPLIFAAALLAAAGAYAQQKEYSLSIGPEGSIGYRRGAVFGGGLGFDYRIKKSTAVGARLGVNYALEDAFSLDPAAFVRWYYYTPSWAEFFGQCDLGVSLVFKPARLETIFIGGLTLGIRFPLGVFYAEPYVRGNYPYIFSAGVMMGRRFW
jgi:hypothetical protein